jgi:hypothetical protein
VKLLFRLPWVPEPRNGVSPGGVPKQEFGNEFGNGVGRVP